MSLKVPVRNALDIRLERALGEAERQRRDVARLQRPRLVHGRDGSQVALDQRQQHVLADGAGQDDRELSWIAECLGAFISNVSDHDIEAYCA